MPRKNKIIIRTGTGAPSASDFVTGEPAFDSSAGTFYIKNAAGTMAQITGGSGGGSTTAIDAGTYPLISISAQPSATTASSGSNATFSVTATATSPTTSITYQWQSSANNSTWANISGATSSTVTVAASSGVNGYYYRCQLTADLSSTYSSSAQLTVASAFTATAVLLTSGTTYTVPTGATSMKAWAVGAGGNRRSSGSAYGGGAGGCAYKTWSVAGGNSVSYSIGTAPNTLNFNADGNNTTVTFGGVTITGGGGKGLSASTGGTYSGGDGGATGGASGALIAGNSGPGGAVGGNGALASCKRVVMTDVSGLLAAAALAGATTTENCVSGTPAFGSGGFSAKYSAAYNAGYGGGGARDSNLTGNGALAGNGCVVLYFT